MTYELTDHAGRMFRTASNTRGDVSVQNIGRKGDAVTVSVPREDAPAVALAILEAAGITANSASEDCEKRAVAYLKVWEQKRAEQDERSAEEANVRTFRAVNLALDSGASPNNIYDDWDDISEWAHENWRTRYRAHRDFFKEGK